MSLWRAKADRCDRFLAELSASRIRAALALIVLGQWWSLPSIVGPATQQSPLASWHPASHRAARICILSRHDLRHGLRVPLMAQALADTGCAVTVVCRGPPTRPTQKGVNGAEYLPVDPGLETGLLRPFGRRPRTQRRQAAEAAAVGSDLLALSPSAGHSRLSQSLQNAPMALLLRMAGRRLKAARRRSLTEAEGAAAPAALPSQRWLQAHAFAEAADRATHARRFDVVQAGDAEALVAAARLAARDQASLLYDAAARPGQLRAIRLGVFEMLCQRCQSHEAAAILRGADIVIASREGLADWHAGVYAIDRPLVIGECRPYWPYRVDRRLRADCAPGASVRLVVWSAPDFRHEEVERLIEAAAVMRADVHIAIVPTGPSHPSADFGRRLASHAAAHGVAERVHLLPPPMPADLVPYLSGADLGVILEPSGHTTDFQNMVAARLPIAAAAGGEVAELVRKHDIGKVFVEPDAKDIAAMVERMLEPATYRRLRENTMSVAEDLTWEAESTAYLAVIRALIPAAAIAEPS